MERLPAGQVTGSTVQRHRYALHPDPKMRIDWTDEDGLRVTYDPGVGSAGGMHTWVYYFHPESGQLAAYRFGEGEDSLWTSSIYLHRDHRPNVAFPDTLFVPPERRGG